jgi:NAD(P)-dependent dehydrogenase (short-subunit alcohol dehydrogenase family)
MASVAVAWGRINFDDLQSERHYTLRAAYGQSKLANLLFAFELERRCKSVGLSVTSLGADPGAAKTNLFLNKGQDWGRRPNAMERLLQLVLTVFSLPVSQAALPALYQATDPSARSDRYIVGNMWPKSGFPRVGKIPDAALDSVTAERLWEESVKLTGVNYELLLGGSAVR